MFDFLKNKKNIPEEPDPAIAAELMAKGESLMEKNEPKKAEKYYSKAMDMYISLFEEDEETYREKAAVCADGLGAVYESLEKYTDAFEQYTLASQLLEEAADAEHPEILEQLADANCNIGDTYFFREMYDDAEKQYNKAMDMYLKLLSSNNEEYLENVAYCYDCLAKSSSGKEDYHISIEHYEKVIEIYEKLVADYKGSPLDGKSISLRDELAGVYGDIGYIHSCIGGYEEAENFYLKAAEIYRELAVNDPDSYSDNLSAQYADLAALYEDMDKPELVREYKKLSQDLDI